MKTIFISSFHPYTSRNILSTDAYRLLVKNQDLRIVLFVHARKKDFIERTFGDANVIVEGVDLDAPSRRKLTLVMKRAAKYCLNSNSVRIQRYMKWKFEKKYAYFFAAFPAWAVFRSRTLRRMMRAMDYFFAEKDRYRKYFDAYEPDAVLITDILNERDVELAQNARFFSVPMIAMVRSWDNLTLHGLMRFLPKKLLVASEEIKKQAEQLNDCPSDAIEIVGVPHYDNYVKGAKISRESFYQEMGLAPSRSLLLFAPIGDFYINHNTTDAHVVSVLSRSDSNVIVRFSPTVPVKDMDGAHAPSHTVFDRPGINFVKNVIADQELSAEDDERLLHEILFSDAVICGPSTVALDAVFLDKPVIIVNFHPDARGYYDGIRRRYDYDHFRFAIACGAFRLANSKEELFSLISDYRKNSSRDAGARAILRRAYCGPSDGRSGERVARAVTNFVSKPAQSAFYREKEAPSMKKPPYITVEEMRAHPEWTRENREGGGTRFEGSTAPGIAFRYFTDKKAAVLDCGPDRGMFAKLLQERGFENVHAVDFYDNVSFPDRSKLTFHLVDMNREVMPYADKFFSGVTAWGIGEHMENPYFFCREVHRVMKPGGIFIFALPNVFHIISRLLFLKKGTFPRWNISNNHITVFTKDTFAKTFLRYFELVETVYTKPGIQYSFFPVFDRFLPANEWFANYIIYVLRWKSIDSYGK